MEVKKLNPLAPPFHCTGRHPSFPPLHPQLQLYHGGACAAPFPFAAAYSCGGAFPVVAYHYPQCGYPVQHMGHPSPPPPKLFSKHVVPAPAPPHGRPPHKLMFRTGAVTVTEEKLHAQAAAKAREAGRPTPVAPRRVLVAAAPCRMLRLTEKTRRDMSKEYRPRRQERAAAADAGRERSSSPVFTTRPSSPLPPMQKLKPSETTVMVRNIPNKLTRLDMVRLLDDHCARANRRRLRGSEALAEYDLVYVRMDFRMCNEHRTSNKGYAFVNFTTAEAARELQLALHGCRWKRRAFDSGKVIDIRAARIQGKEALVRHFARTTYFECGTDEYLPAVFSPPRDGSPSPADGEAVKTVGFRIPPRHVARLGSRDGN
ncbi:hypothetical protein GUJ93_ZPchr0002g25663 [Zizania palustris]|uniref:RRM domain-containing protein n=1 Tax=Zizania palustris TaxID=103762 RepID=A0A8J5SN17_ZIZPA|nr:hypothetical protein GUJ93_ZPchr0002g25663 [Zizania palustris]